MRRNSGVLTERKPLWACVLRVLSIFLALVFVGCSGKPYAVQPPGNASLVSGNPGHHQAHQKIYVVSHGWHTGLVVPTDEIANDLPALKARFGNVPYLEFGWGDKGFYQAKKITVGLSLRAMFWPTETVMHIVAVPNAPAEYFPHSEVLPLCLDQKSLAGLKTFLLNSFARDESGNVVMLKNGLYGDSQFYKGVGEYYLMNTCNKWTAKGLKSGGMDISPMFKLSAGSVVRYIKSTHNAVVATCHE